MIVRIAVVVEVPDDADVVSEIQSNLESCGWTVVSITSEEGSAE